MTCNVCPECHGPKACDMDLCESCERLQAARELAWEEQIREVREHPPWNPPSEGYE